VVMRYDLAFLKGDTAAMERQVALGERSSGHNDSIADHQGFAAAYSGKLQLAKTMARRAADLARQSNQAETAVLYETGAALWEAFSGKTSEARQSAMAGLKLSKARDVEFGNAFVLVLSGESSESQTAADDLEKRFPEDTSVKFSYLPALRAGIALNHGDSSKALEQLRIAAPYELGAPHSSFEGFFGTFYPVYVRGEAYMAAHKGAEAAAEFQKILDHRGIVVSDPVGALARLEIGRAFALAGDKTKAKAAYQDFLTLWKDADPDLPIFQQAKAEYAKLQ